MGKRDDKYQLNDMIEIDDTYIKTCTDEVSKKNLKRGKGSQRQTKTTVMAESIILEEIEKGTVGKQCRYFKMVVNPSEKSEKMEELIGRHVSKEAVAFSDNSKAYVKINRVVKAHLIENSNMNIEKQTLKWVHIAISNVKRNLLGIYHSVNESYLQMLP